MKLSRQIAIAAACAALIVPSWAAGPQDAQEHQAHHPAGVASGGAPSADMMARMDQHMKQMQALHDKMAGAKTPAERRALMAEHMKAMQDGMAVMSQMGGAGMRGMAAAGQMPGGQAMPGDMAGRQEMLEKRMDMMQSMMQMMMDRMPNAPAK